MSNKSNFRRERLVSAHRLRVVDYCGKAWRQGQEAAGHGVTAVRKQRERNVDAQLAFSFLVSTGTQLKKWCCPHLV